MYVFNWYFFNLHIIVYKLLYAFVLDIVYIISVYNYMYL